MLVTCKYCGEDKHRVQLEPTKVGERLRYADDKGVLWDSRRCPACAAQARKRWARPSAKASRTNVCRVDRGGCGKKTSNYFLCGLCWNAKKTDAICGGIDETYDLMF